jgi:hypothetical protein
MLQLDWVAFPPIDQNLSMKTLAAILFIQPSLLCQEGSPPLCYYVPMLASTTMYFRGCSVVCWNSATGALYVCLAWLQGACPFDVMCFYAVIVLLPVVSTFSWIV